MIGRDQSADIGKDTQFKEGQSGNPNGRPLSFKKEYVNLLNNDSAIIWKQVKWVGTKEQFNEYGSLSNLPIKTKGEGDSIKFMIGFQLSKKESVLAKFDRLMMTSKDAVALQAIKFIWEQIDGRAGSSLEITGKDGKELNGNYKLFVNFDKLEELPSEEGNIDD